MRFVLPHILSAGNDDHQNDYFDEQRNALHGPRAHYSQVFGCFSFPSSPGQRQSFVQDVNTSRFSLFKFFR